MITQYLKRFSFLACLSWAFSLSVLAQSATGAREGEVAVGQGVQIHYVEGGLRDAKTTLLFIPGWCMSSAVWRDQMAGFAATSRVVSIDPRSQGASTVTTQSNTPEQRAQDLRAVIASLKLTNVVMVGWSQGVQDVAAYAAAFQGDAIAGYVLVDAPVGAGPEVAIAKPDALKEELKMLAIYQQYPKAYLQVMMNAIIRSPEGRKRIDEFVQIGLRTPPDLGISMLLMDFVVYDRRAALAKFNRPTLVVAAAQSSELEQQREMSRTIRDAQFEIVEKAGHALFLDQPQHFHDLLAAFVSRTE